VNNRGEEAGEQNLDWMDKNCVERHRVRDELARDSKVRKGSKQLYVNAVRIRGKSSYLIRGGLLFFIEGQKSAEAIVVDGVTTIRGDQGNLVTGGRAERMRS
jgi:hypothetical protein